MEQIYPLDRVIRPVHPSTPAEPGSQELVIVDVKKKEVVPKAGWRDVRAYLVSNRSDPAHESRLVIPAVTLSDLDERLEVSVTVLVNCAPGHEAHVALALFDPTDPPETVLERRVIRCLRESGQDDVRAFVQRFFGDPATMQHKLAQAVEGATGLTVRMKLELQPVQVHEAVEVPETHVPVRPSDWDEPLDLGFRADLQVDDAVRAAAVLQNGRVEELQRLVPREITRFVRQNVSLREFPGLGTGPLKRSLVAHLDEVLRPWGRRVGALVLTPESSSVPPELAVLDEVEITCKVREYADPVSIGIRAHVQVLDLVTYRGAGSLDLRTWLSDTLRRLIPEILFQARYTDLLLRFEQWEEKIRVAVEAAAALIGCEISQFITAPALPQRALVHPFVLRTEGAYQTLFPDVEAKLEVVVTARIPCLEKIAPLLSTTPDICHAMEEAVHAAIRGRMHGIHPERFYMHFGRGSAGNGVGGAAADTPSVEEELIELVQRRLTGAEFHAEVISTVLKVPETELIGRLRKLQEATLGFAVRVETLDYEEVEFVGNLRVLTVDPEGWQQFRRLTGGVEQIVDEVRDRVDTVLHALSTRELLYQGEDERLVLAKEVSDQVMRYAAVEFGLVVRVSNFRRRRTARENERHAGLARHHGDVDTLFRQAELTDYASLVDALRELVDRRNRYMGEVGDEEELARVEREITAVKARLDSARALSAAQVRPAIGPGGADRPALLETAANEEASREAKDREDEA